MFARDPVRLSILLVDDDARGARRICRMLQEDGYDVELAFDGASAIARLSRDPTPDVLVADVRMPHADGIAVARYALFRRPDLRLVFLTGYPDLVADAVFEARPLVLTKPISYADLGAVLDPSPPSKGRRPGAAGGGRQGA